MFTVVLLCAVLVLLAVMVISKGAFQNRKYQDIPTVGRRWPIVGNIFDFSRTHLIFTEWSKLYGPIFRINVFGEESVVLNDYETIYEALVTKGSSVAGRPKMYRTANAERNKNSIVWQTFTPKLQFLRKTVHKSMKLYGAGIEKLEGECLPEMGRLVNKIKESELDPIDPWDLFYNTACNVMLSLVLGIRLPYDSEGMSRLKDINRLFNHSFGPGSSRRLDVLPWLNIFNNSDLDDLRLALKLRNSFWDDYLPNMDRSKPRRDCVVSDLHGISGQEEYRDMDISNDTMKETFTNLMLAGTDTTTTALTCFLLILLHNPDVQRRLHQEIDSTIGTRPPCLQDRLSLPFVEASLLETLRYISHVPLAVPHETICDTSICGKTIPAKTPVYINLWALHHDERYWKDPWTFDPGRFLDSTGHVVPASHENRKRLLVFGAGRRVCLGETLAKNRLFLFATSLLQNFKFLPEDETRLPEVDPRSYSLGIVLHPERFKVRAVCRRTDINRHTGLAQNPSR